VVVEDDDQGTLGMAVGVVDSVSRSRDVHLA
jgi:hypothetical protein